MRASSLGGRSQPKMATTPAPASGDRLMKPERPEGSARRLSDVGLVNEDHSGYKDREPPISGAWRSLVSALDWGSRGRWFKSSRPESCKASRMLNLAYSSALGEAA